MAVPPWERGGSKKLNCFTLALLLIRSRSLAGRSLVTTEKSVNNLPGTEQLANRGKDRCTSGCGVQYAIGGRSEICPRGRHQSAAAVGKHDQQLETATSIIPTQQLERLPFERMTASNNLNPPRVAVEMMVVMGSVSTIPSTRLTTSYCSNWFSGGFATSGCCVLSGGGLRPASWRRIRYVHQCAELPRVGCLLPEHKR